MPGGAGLQLISDAHAMQGAHADLLPFLDEQRASWHSYATGTPSTSQASLC